MEKVLVGMSGGVDSATAALLLKKQGYEVVGVFIRSGVEDDNSKSCCSAYDAYSARRIADKLGIAFYSIDAQENFGTLIDYFINNYGSGKTPSPCIKCNKEIKFAKLIALADALDADYVATGHYAKIEKIDDYYLLRKPLDLKKDQSYFLAGLSQNELARLLFPLQDVLKGEVRAIAKESQLSVFDKPDSQEICFVPADDYRTFLEKSRDFSKSDGDIVDVYGNVLGSHKGIHNYTVGQRHGLGIALGKPAYVVKIEPQTNRIMIGDKEELKSKTFTVEKFNWISYEYALRSMFCVPLQNDFIRARCNVRIRYAHRESSATLYFSRITPSNVAIDFDTPQEAITPGQFACCYQDSVVIGGGWIENVNRITD